MAVITTAIDRGTVRAARGWLVIAAVLVGVPAVLWSTVGSPIPSGLPDIADTWLAVQQRNISGGVVVKTLAVGAWLLWLQLAWAVLWEALVNTQRLASNLEVRPAPFVASGIRNLAVRFASGTVVVAMATTSATPVAALVSSSAVVLDIEEAAPLAAVTTEPTTSANDVAPQSACWVVQPDESAWSIASMALGDGSRFNEIAALNPSIQGARDVVPGARLILPDGAMVPADRSGDHEPKSAGEVFDQSVEAPARFLTAADIEIVKGDHLWGLSEARLQEAMTLEPTDREVLDYVNAVIGANTDIIEDPDLIYPGEVFHFPEIGEPIAEPALPAEVVVPEAKPLEGIWVAPEAPVSPTTQLSSEPEEVSAAAPNGAVDDSSLRGLLGVVGAVVAATGLAALVSSLRRRREVRRAGQPLPIGPVERAVTEAANLPLLRWAGQEIAVLFESLDNAALTSAPVAVDVYAEGIEILWEGVQDGAPHPWEATDGGVAWRLLYDADAPIPTDELPSAVPGLVALGERPGGVTTLVDLEALGSLSISGDAVACGDVVRSIATELATSREVANARIALVGFELEGDHHFDAVSSIDEDEALSLIAEATNQYRLMIEASQVSDSFQLRVRAGSGPEVLVVVASADHCSNLAELIAAAEPRRGVALVVVGAVESAKSRLLVTGEGRARLEPMGLDLTAASLPKAASAAIVDLLDELGDEQMEAPAGLPNPATMEAQPAGERSALSSRLDLLTLVDGSEFGQNKDTAEVEDDWQPPSSRVTVRLLGEPLIAGYEDLRIREVSLLGFLVCKGGSASVQCVMDHLWADQGAIRKRKTLHNLESRVRAAVGADVLPLSPSSHPLTTTATSDLAIFEALVERSKEVSSGRAIELLDQALGLIDGPPFDHGAFEWARSIGVYDRLRQQIEAAALRLVELALEADEVDVARTGIQQALTGLGLNEPLYRAWMRVEAQAGNPGAVRNVFRELEHRLEAMFDDPAVSRQTQMLCDQLLARDRTSDETRSA